MSETPQTEAAKKRIIILGAVSAIAESAARMWAALGARIVLSGRSVDRLQAVAADLRVRGGTVEIIPIDLAIADTEKSFRQMVDHLGGVDIVLLAYGELGNQNQLETSPEAALRNLAVNFSSAAAWCLCVANVLEAQGNGVLIVIGSVAGDRGRASNYIYGAAKGGLGVLVQGIAHRLSHTGARAVLIKPGFVNTPMTASVPNKGFLWSEPHRIAKIIVRAGAENGRARPIRYAPWFWRWIMYVTRFMPAFIFHRTKL